MKSHSVAITLLRFVLSAWIGAAVLYVITSVAEQTSPDFDSVMRDQLATIRFPLYYQFGVGTYVAAGILSIVVQRLAPTEMRRKATLVVILIVVSAVIFAWDYFCVYRPLQQLITPPGNVRTTEFMRLHTMSRNINMVHLLIMMAAAIIACTPAVRHPSRQAASG